MEEKKTLTGGHSGAPRPTPDVLDRMFAAFSVEDFKTTMRGQLALEGLDNENILLNENAPAIHRALQGALRITANKIRTEAATSAAPATGLIDPPPADTGKGK